MQEDKGLRYNEGKLRVDLIPPEWILGLAEVMTKGAEKYEARNWEKGMEWSKCYASLLRHTLKFWSGEDIDPESGLPHAYHIAWNALALYTYSQTHPEYDDRPERSRPETKEDASVFADGWKKVAGTIPLFVPLQGDGRG
jgi:hypothetical protein